MGTGGQGDIQMATGPQLDRSDVSPVSAYTDGMSVVKPILNLAVRCSLTLPRRVGSDLRLCSLGPWHPRSRARSACHLLFWTWPCEVWPSRSGLLVHRAGRRPSLSILRAS